MLCVRYYEVHLLDDDDDGDDDDDDNNNNNNNNNNGYLKKLLFKVRNSRTMTRNARKFRYCSISVSHMKYMGKKMIFFKLHSH
jgi:hypothetical protein